MNQHIAMPHISVESPVTHNSWEDGKFITYDIIVNCEDDSCPLFALSRSTVSRRYREFRWLRKKLCSVPSATVRRVPPLPTVGCPLFDDRFSPDFIEARRRGLEEFLQGACAIPTLLSEAALHLFLQTDLSVAEIDAYVDRKWGRREEVCEVILTLHQQRQCEERDEIASLASVGRWSEASLLDFEEDASSNDSSAHSKQQQQAGSESLTNHQTTSSARSACRRPMYPRQVSVSDSQQQQVVSPVLGLYLPPDENDRGDGTVGVTAPVIVRSRRVNEVIASSAPSALVGGIHNRRSRSVQIRIPSSSSSRGGDGDSPASNSPLYSPQNRILDQRQHLSPPSSSFSPSNNTRTSDEPGGGGPQMPTSVDIYNRRRPGKHGPHANGGTKAKQYYCSNAVWLSSSATAAAATDARRPTRRTLSPGGIYGSTPTTNGSSSQATSSLSPPSSSPIASSSVSSGGRRASSTNALP